MSRRENRGENRGGSRVERVNNSDVAPRAMSSILRNEDASRLMNATFASDLAKRFPSLEGICDRDMMVMMGVSLGFSYRRLSKALNISVGTVHNICNRIDPEGMYRLDRDSMAEYIAGRARAMAGEVLSEVDLSQLSDDPIRQIDAAKKLTDIAHVSEKKCVDDSDDKVRRVVVEFVNAGSSAPDRDIEDGEFHMYPESSDGGTAIDGVRSLPECVGSVGSGGDVGSVGEDVEDG